MRKPVTVSTPTPGTLNMCSVPGIFSRTCKIQQPCKEQLLLLQNENILFIIKEIDLVFLICIVFISSGDPRKVPESASEESATTLEIPFAQYVVMDAWSSPHFHPQWCRAAAWMALWGYFAKGCMPVPKITEQKKDAIRMDILNTARKIFIDKGYEATSMKDIVTSSGRSFGGVYLYFSNKEDVFLELLRQEFRSMGSELEAGNQMNAWSALVHFLGDQERRARELENGLAPCMYEYFIVGRREEGRRKLIEERYRAISGGVFQLIQNGIQEGEFHPSHSVQPFVHWLISSLDGFFLETMMNGADAIQLAEQFELVKTFCRMILMPIEREEDE